MRHVLCSPLATYQHQVREARLSRKNWQKIPVPEMPVIPEGLPPMWKSAATLLVSVFEVFQELRPQIPVVCGDTGLSSLFAFSPFACIDTCSYYGGSLPMAIGFHLAGFRHPWAVTGDYAFLVAGQMGLIEAFVRKIPLKVLIIDNGRAMATGGQPIPLGLYHQILSGWKPFVSYIETPQDKLMVKSVFIRILASNRLEIVSARFRP
jgi:hypothetical protein